MLRFRLSLAHSRADDGSTPTSDHVPFYLALEYTAEAWQRALATTCTGLLEPRDLGVVNVTSDFGRELFVGPADFDVSLLRLGTSSLTFHIQVLQRGEPAADVTITLAQVDGRREHSVPLAPDQRAALSLLGLANTKQGVNPNRMPGDRVQALQPGLLVREVAAGLDRPPIPGVQELDRVRGTDGGEVLDVIVQKRG